jgi:hypothetical protein
MDRSAVIVSVRGVAAAIALVITWSWGGCADAGELQSAVLAVHVQSTAGEPLGARVFVIGTGKDASSQAIADRAGNARFVVPDGRYWISAEAVGFQTAREAVDTEAGSVRDVLIEMSPLQEIGRSHSRVVASTQSSSPASIPRRIAPNLAEALSSVAGVAATAGDSGLGIRASLEGDDEAMTTFSYGGAPLPANAAALAINTDLVQTVQVDQSRESIQFIGLGPAPAPVSNVKLRAGSYGSALSSVSFQDTLGAVGVAVLHTLRAQESPINGSVYADSSGTTYRHVGALHAAGDYIKATAPVGTWAGSAVFTTTRVRATPLATYFAGSVPYGTGPGERSDSTTRNPVVALNGAVASTSVALTYAEFATTLLDSQDPRIAAGASFPFDVRERSIVRTYSASVERGLTAGAILEGAFQSFTQGTTAEVNGITDRVAHKVEEVTLGLRGAEHENGAWRTDYRIGRVDGRAYGTLAGTLRRRAGPHLTFDGGASFGTVAEQGNDVRIARGWLEPYAADVDCGDHTIVAEGPGDAAATPRRFRAHVSAAWSAPTFHVAASAWYARTRNQLLSSALVPLSGTDPSLPPGYVPALLAQAGLPTRCGTPGTYDIFARRDVAGVGTTNAGVAVNASYDRGRHHLEASAELVSTRLDTIAGALRAPMSIYLPGRQLPGVPLVRGTLSYDRTVGSRLELLASVHYEGSNNRHNLPPFAMTSVGVSYMLRPSASLTVVAGNVFDEFAGTFVSSRYAAPIATLGGRTLLGVAAPLPPLRVSAQLDVRIRRP